LKRANRDIKPEKYAAIVTEKSSGGVGRVEVLTPATERRIEDFRNVKRWLAEHK
jgi:hypothetical protein